MEAVELSEPDDYAEAVAEAYHDGERDEGDERALPDAAEEELDGAGDDDGVENATDAVHDDDRRQDDSDGTGSTTDHTLVVGRRDSR